MFFRGLLVEYIMQKKFVDVNDGRFQLFVSSFNTTDCQLLTQLRKNNNPVYFEDKHDTI